MKKIRFTQDHGVHANGTVIGTTDSAADALVAQGKAVHVASDVRDLRYSPAAKTQSECIVPVFEEKEAAPKGAAFPDEIAVSNDGEASTVTNKDKKTWLQ